MPQKCPCPSTNPLAKTVYPLQGGKVHPNFENKNKFREKNFLASTTTRKIRWFHWWNPFLNPLTIKGDICTFVTAVSGLSNRSPRSIYNYARRPIIRTGQHLPCAAFSSYLYCHFNIIIYLQIRKQHINKYLILSCKLVYQGLEVGISWTVVPPRW